MLADVTLHNPSSLSDMDSFADAIGCVMTQAYAVAKVVENADLMAEEPNVDVYVAIASNVPVEDPFSASDFEHSARTIATSVVWIRFAMFAANVLNATVTTSYRRRLIASSNKKIKGLALG